MSEIAKPDLTAPTARDLKLLTPARLALQRTGVSIATRDTLAFALDHALARDAVHAGLSLPTLLRELQSRELQAVAVRSATSDRATYLRRPDLGRKLSDASSITLHALAITPNVAPLMDSPLPRLSIILADGLSALAADRHVLCVLDALLPRVRDAWELTPIVVAEQARVALGDEIGVLLGAQLTVMLIGERPGLSAADSLGAYITWNPRQGRTNAERNCISNIRAEGLSYSEAAARIAYFLRVALRLQLTGATLKDPATTAMLE